VWRTEFEGTTFGAVFEDELIESALSKDKFVILTAEIVKEVPGDAEREDTLKNIEKLSTGQRKRAIIRRRAR
jgi:hypothetical protein